VPNPDIVAEVGEMPDELRPFIVGFAAESDDLEVNALSKLRDKGLDLIVGNRIGGPFDAIGSDENKVTVFGAEGALTDWPMLPKRQVAERLWDLIGDRYRTGRGSGDSGEAPARPRRSSRSTGSRTRRST
jgi:phosphopantothenoylcysteine decarboxylase/phosphopantothenate--cysteine ligase